MFCGRSSALEIQRINLDSIIIQKKSKLRMVSTISSVQLKETLRNNVCTWFYENYQPSLQEFVKHLKQNKSTQSQQLDDLLELLCNVMDSTQSERILHEVVVLINSILNLKSQLVVRITSRRKTTLKVIGYFKQCYYRFENEKQGVQEGGTKTNFEIYSILHLVTTLLNSESKQKNREKSSLLRNSSLINTILSIDLQLLVKNESIHLVSILITLLVKKSDTSNHSSRMKEYILEHITSVRELKSIKNFIQSLRRLLTVVKLEERQVSKSGIVEWIMPHLKQKGQQDIADMLDLIGLLLMKLPHLGHKFIALNLIQTLKKILHVSPFMVCRVLEELTPCLDDSIKQDIHNFFLQSFRENYKSVLALLNKMVTSCRISNLVECINNGLMKTVQIIFRHEQCVVTIHLLFEYLENIIKTIWRQSQDIARCLVDKIRIEGIVDPTENSNMPGIRERYLTFKRTNLV